VRHLNEVVDLRCPPECASHPRRRSTVGVRTDLHVVFDDHGAGLRDLLMRAVGAADEPIPVAAQHDAVLENHSIAHGHPLADRHLRVHDAIFPDHRAGADRHVGVHDGPVADSRAVTQS
jgi:hypothetical protein